MLLRQDKGRGIVIMDKNKYTSKCLNILNTPQFKKLNRDPTKPLEEKIQRAVRKVKNRVSKQEYYRIYPTGSAPGKFYGIAKKHKLPTNGTIDDLPLRPIVSNIGTASYQLAKYLAKLLSPLSISEYTVANNMEFINHVRTMNVPKDHSFISFDVKSLYTYVPLDFTINVILRRIYDENEIQTNIKRSEMKELLLLCTKNVHFSFDNEIYQQCDGVAMGSPLGPVIAGIFMVELERTLLPRLLTYMTPWKRYVDDTIATIKVTSIDHVLKILNSFHKNIQFTYELETNNKISFLDVLLIRENNTLETTIYRKGTNTGVYLHWNSFAPKTWKRSTLRSILTRAYKICSTNELLDKELKHIEKEFIEINEYPKWIINQLKEECKLLHEKNNNTTHVVNNIHSNDNSDNNTANNINVENITTHMLVLPYKGDKGEKLMKSLNKHIKQVLPENHQSRFAYKSKKLGAFFNIKDQTKLEHYNDLNYLVDCPVESCSENYLGETARRINERVLEHAGKDKKSHMLRHTLQSGHPSVSLSDFKILVKGYKNNRMKRKISEALLIKQYRPTLNKQENSIPLELFN